MQPSSVPSSKETYKGSRGQNPLPPGTEEVSPPYGAQPYNVNAKDMPCRPSSASDTERLQQALIANQRIQDQHLLNPTDENAQTNGRFYRSINDNTNSLLGQVNTVVVQRKGHTAEAFVSGWVGTQYSKGNCSA